MMKLVTKDSVARAAEGADTKESATEDALFECLDILMDLDAIGRQHSDRCDCDDCALYDRIEKVIAKHEAAFHRLALIDALQRSIAMHAKSAEVKA